MPSRIWFLAFLLGGAFLPYLLSNSSGVREAITSPLKAISASEDKPAAAQATITAEGTPAQNTAAGGSPVAAKFASQSSAPREHVVTLEQALQWQVTPAWILGNWARVTTHLAELDTQGYRVTLVTGTAQTDVAGSLTYYFDPTQTLQKIVFNGTTGDARTLVQFLIARHRFERRMTSDPSVYVYQVEQDGQALSELKIRTAPVVKVGNAYSRFEITLVMNRPVE